MNRLIARRVMSLARPSYFNSPDVSLCNTTLPRDVRVVPLSQSRADLIEARHITSNDDFIKKVVNADVPVIVTFHAEWCDPCKTLLPRLKTLIEPLNTLHLAVVDVEKHPELVESFEVKAVPAVIAMKNGTVVDKFIGLVDDQMISNLLKKLSSME